MTYEEILKNIYYNPSNPASFGSVTKLYSAAKLEYPQISISQVKDWLSGENTYTLHRQARRIFSREKILVSYPNEQFQADLVDMQQFSRYNNGYKYILTCIDCFSKFSFAVPIKNKQSISVKKAFEKIFAIRKPDSLQTDRGKEFLNKIVLDYFKNLEINFFTTKNTQFKCAIVERFNRTLKSKMFKYFSSKGTRKYIDVLDNLIDAYNNSFHRSIKIEPVNVNDTNKDIIFKNIYGYETMRQYLATKTKTPRLKKGDTVRIKYELTPMDKGYYPNWTDVLYKVDNSIKGINKPMYKLKSVDNVILNRNYYPEEIQKVKENFYRIEKIVKPETRNGRRGFIVKWIGYSANHNSWVPADEIRNVRNN